MSMRGALVVGIDDYPGAPLRGCVNDANAIASALRTNGDGGPNFSVNLLTAPADTVSRSRADTISRSSLKGAIEQLFVGSDCDICLFYFSGHGLITSTGGYIVTQDAEEYDEGVSMDDILRLANRSKAKDKVIFLDCCHSGALGNPAITQDLAALSEGLCILTASRDSESALEKDGRGVFTSLVVDALKGGAADLRGCITPGSIYAYVDPVLGPWDQRPMFKSNVTRMTSLRSIPPPVPLEILRKICTYFPAPRHEYALDPSYETETVQTNSANVAIMKDLRQLASVGLVVPVGAEYMYFAAMNSKSCRLTTLGHQYWRLVNAGRV
jgi:hypothetical protein